MSSFALELRLRRGQLHCGGSASATPFLHYPILLTISAHRLFNGS